MKGSIGSAFLYNLIAVFILVVFAFLAGTLSYYKAFKINAQIMTAIEKYEGYNHLAVTEIDRMLKNMGYNIDIRNKCPRKDGVNPSFQANGYCIYEFNEGRGYRTYGVMSYIHLDLPVISDFAQIPIFSKTIKIYNLG